MFIYQAGTTDNPLPGRKQNVAQIVLFRNFGNDAVR